jgi:flagellar basal-body rod modification protein FlgD
MSHQDPLEPVDNTEMLAQLAQFSSLEQMSNLNDSFETLSGNMDQLNFISATSLLGRNITGVDMSGEVRSGTVERVHLDGSIVYLTVDGNLMSMAGVMGIETTNDESDTTSDGEGAKGYMPYDQFMRQ